MAEGRNQSSIQDGSDADITFICTPCSQEGTKEEAIKYCPECDEYLCTICTKYHLKMKISREHKLVDREEGKHELKTARKSKLKCWQHPDRDIEMYCGTHDMVYCLMCIATDHRSCSDVTNLTDAAGSDFQQNDIDRLQEESESVEKLLQETEKQKQQNIVLVDEKINKILKRVQEKEDSMIHHIKSLSKEARVTLDGAYTKAKGELESEITVLSRRGIEVGKVKSQLQSTTEVNQEHRFVQFKLCKRIVNDAKTLHAKCKSNGQISIEFAENADVTEKLCEVKTFGKIETSCVNRKREIKQQKEIKCRMQNDMGNCRIIDMCRLDNGAYILADLNNNKIKILDTNHNVSDQFHCGCKPTGVCKFSYNEVAVKLASNEIKLLSVGPRISKVRNINIKEDGGYWGMTYTVGKFWVANGHDVNIYNTDGCFEKNVGDKTCQKIFKSTPLQMTVYQNLVYVADSRKGIVCLRSDGTKKSELRDSRLTFTVGVCISSDGIVYAIDKPSKMIIMFSQDGQCLGELIPEVPKEKFPESLCYDNKNNCILVGYTSSDTVTMLYLSD